MKVARVVRLCGVAACGLMTAVGAAADGEESSWTWALEGKVHARSSDEVIFVTNFPDPQLPPQERVAMESVDPGDHFELSVLSLYLEGSWGDGAIQAKAKIDFIDLYDRNPTSTASDLDVDEAWIRFGREAEPAELAPRGGAYLKVGKFPKFERQDDRHLESYGLVSTAFNRMEDVGVELGVRAGRHLYFKLSATQGNPVFFRDPLALAGDNGTPELLRDEPARLGSGIGFPYDADVQDLDVDGDLELGAGIGLRLGDDSGARALDVLVWGYQRQLAETVPLDGSFYGGDLDFLRGPGNGFPFPLEDDDKVEVGANVWLYLGGFSFFGQYVDQDLGGLDRIGYEAEVAWLFDLPLRWSAGGRQLFSYLAPAVRYSKLEPDFAIPALTPSPSFGWEWEKIDAGLRLGILGEIDLTVEYALNRFQLLNGRWIDHDEGLVTLRFRWGSEG